MFHLKKIYYSLGTQFRESDLQDSSKICISNRGRECEWNYGRFGDFLK